MFKDRFSYKVVFLFIVMIFSIGVNIYAIFKVKELNGKLNIQEHSNTTKTLSNSQQRSELISMRQKIELYESTYPIGPKSHSTQFSFADLGLKSEFIDASRPTTVDEVQLQGNFINQYRFPIKGCTTLGDWCDMSVWENIITNKTIPYPMSFEKSQFLMLKEFPVFSKKDKYYVNKSGLKFRESFVYSSYEYPGIIYYLEYRGDTLNGHSFLRKLDDVYFYKGSLKDTTDEDEMRALFPVKKLQFLRQKADMISQL